MKKKTLIITSIVTLIVFIVVLCIAVPKTQKKQQQKRWEEIYKSKIEESIEAFKPTLIDDIKKEYGEEYANLSVDIDYSLIVYDSGEIWVSYRINGDEILEKYSDERQKWPCHGFFELFSELGTYYMCGQVHVNGTLCFKFDDYIEYLEENRNTRLNTCWCYFCYEDKAYDSGYCSFHKFLED